MGLLDDFREGLAALGDAIPHPQNPLPPPLLFPYGRGPSALRTPKVPRTSDARTYDFTGERGARVGGMPFDLSGLRPGDRVETDGASVSIADDGRPLTTLKPGYDEGRRAAMAGPILVPRAPPSVDVNANIRTARTLNAPRGLLDWWWFARREAQGGDWNYKQAAPDRAPLQYEALGNFNYGAAGQAGGYPGWLLNAVAGRLQHNSRPEWGRPSPRNLFLGSGNLGDDPDDQFWIKQGLRYEDSLRRPAPKGR